MSPGVLPVQRTMAVPHTGAGAMAVNEAVTVLQLCRGIITQVCDSGLSCHADPGIEVPSQQDIEI